MERIWDGFKFGLGFALAMGLLYVIAFVLIFTVFGLLSGLPLF